MAQDGHMQGGGRFSNTIFEGYFTKKKCAVYVVHHVRGKRDGENRRENGYRS
jgi:hypothetical protein